MDGWNTTLLLGRPIFRGYISFREGNHPKFHKMQPSKSPEANHQWSCHNTRTCPLGRSKPNKKFRPWGGMGTSSWKTLGGKKKTRHRWFPLFFKKKNEDSSRKVRLEKHLALPVILFSSDFFQGFVCWQIFSSERLAVNETSPGWNHIPLWDQTLRFCRLRL